MTNSGSSESMRRLVRAAVSALALLVVSVSLGGTLGIYTNSQFRDIQKSWIEYSEGAERKGILLSKIRGLLGYGGMIHNFKNYVLRQEARYLEQMREQFAEFDIVVSQFRSLDLSNEERAALNGIKDTIDKYAMHVTLTELAAEQNWPPGITDSNVRVDDQEAIAGLVTLERIWAEIQSNSSNRLLWAVGQGQTLIWIGYMSILALVLAAFIVGWMFFLLFRDLRSAITDLADELKERRRLEKSEGRLATAVEQSPATIFITDTHARIQYVNIKFTQLTGWTLDDVKGQTPAFLQSGDTEQSVYKDIRDGLARGEAWHGVFRNRKKDGSSYWAETTILPLVTKDGDTENFIGISEDITEKRQARDQVVRAQKLEAVGQLASGVAHDFNNILMTILGSAHLAALDASEGSDLAGEIAQIDIAARRAQSLIRELLTFARREPGRRQPVNVGAIVEEVVGLLQASVPPMVSLHYTPVGPPLFVQGDPTHMHQVVMNLCRNAAEALAGAKGQIQILVKQRDGTANSDGIEGAVQLIVEDDGPGMSADTQKHLFEPFFTTKPLGKGSGLGLAVVYDLVDQMGGQISVQSEKDNGSTFTIDMPAVDGIETEGTLTDRLIPRGTERILLVDDEAEVMGTLRRILLRLGYRVEAFTSPTITLERFRADPSRFDIVISDMVMPDLSGEELVREMRSLRADIPVIFCSAYKPRKIDVPGLAPTMLDKPVQPYHLAQEIRASLNDTVTTKG